MTPRRELYKASRQSVGRVDIRHGLNEDLYVNFAGLNADDMPVVEAYLFPLVNWVWIGAMVLLLGTCVTLIPPLPDRAALQG
jgi:cytochrome c biogenesis factor